MNKLGKLIIFGSGETSPTGKVVFRNFFLTVGSPKKIAVLETPAGFQPNSVLVAEEVVAVIKGSLKNLKAGVVIIAARKKGTVFSPDNPEVIKPLEEANFIFLGPGSPTYAYRELNNSLALKKIKERWRAGATLCFASAAAAALGAKTLPVYEIYKAGSELFWEEGFNLLKEIGLELVVIPHWNNNAGGKKLDTSRCFMGRSRFEEMRKLISSEARNKVLAAGEVLISSEARNKVLKEVLIPDAAIFGVEENTAVVFWPQEEYFTVEGKGNAVLQWDEEMLVFKKHRAYDWQSLKEKRVIEREYPGFGKERPNKGIINLVSLADLDLDLKALFSERENARRNKDFKKADEIRLVFKEKGFEIQDTKGGQRLYRRPKK